MCFSPHRPDVGIALCFEIETISEKYLVHSRRLNQLGPWWENEIDILIRLTLGRLKTMKTVIGNLFKVIQISIIKKIPLIKEGSSGQSKEVSLVYPVYSAKRTLFFYSNFPRGIM